jgi:hypothetical protein
MVIVEIDREMVRSVSTPPIAAERADGGAGSLPSRRYIRGHAGEPCRATVESCAHYALSLVFPSCHTGHVPLWEQHFRLHSLSCFRNALSTGAAAAFYYRTI